MKVPTKNFVEFLAEMGAIPIKLPPCEVHLHMAAHLMGWAATNDFAMYRGDDGEHYVAHASRWYFVPTGTPN